MYFLNTNKDAVSQALAASHQQAQLVHIQLNETSRALDTAKRILNDDTYWASYASKHNDMETKIHRRMFRALEFSVRWSYTVLSGKASALIQQAEDAVANSRKHWKHTHQSNSAVRVEANNALAVLRLVRDLIPPQLADIKQRLVQPLSRENDCRIAFQQLRSELRVTIKEGKVPAIHPSMVWIDNSFPESVEIKEALRQAASTRIGAATSLDRLNDYGKFLGESDYGIRLHRLRHDAAGRAKFEKEQHERRLFLNSELLTVELAFSRMLERRSELLLLVPPLAKYAEAEDHTHGWHTHTASNNMLVVGAELVALSEAIEGWRSKSREQMELYEMIREYADSCFKEEPADSEATS